MQSVIARQLQAGRVLAHLPKWKRLRDKAIDDIRAMLARSRNPYVALSWGKQSICMAHMVFSVDRAVEAICWIGEDSELLADFASVSKRFLDLFPMRYRELHRGIELRPAIEAHHATNEHDGRFVGLAAEESRARRMTLAKCDAHNIFRHADGTLRCCPLARWTVLDLAAYIATHNLPLLRPYIRFGLDTRTATGSRPGSATENAVYTISGGAAHELRRRWSERGLA